MEIKVDQEASFDLDLGQEASCPTLIEVVEIEVNPEASFLTSIGVVEIEVKEVSSSTSMWVMCIKVEEGASFSTLIGRGPAAEGSEEGSRGCNGGHRG